MAGIGVYVYGMFSIMGSVFALQDELPGKLRAFNFNFLNIKHIKFQEHVTL